MTFFQVMEHQLRVVEPKCKTGKLLLLPRPKTSATIECPTTCIHHGVRINSSYNGIFVDVSFFFPCKMLEIFPITCHQDFILRLISVELELTASRYLSRPMTPILPTPAWSSLDPPPPPPPTDVKQVCQLFFNFEAFFLITYF